MDVDGADAGAAAAENPKSTDYGTLIPVDSYDRANVFILDMIEDKGSFRDSVFGEPKYFAFYPSNINEKDSIVSQLAKFVAEQNRRKFGRKKKGQEPEAFVDRVTKKSKNSPFSPTICYMKTPVVCTMEGKTMPLICHVASKCKVPVEIVSMLWEDESTLILQDDGDNQLREGGELDARQTKTILDQINDDPFKDHVGKHKTMMLDLMGLPHKSKPLDAESVIEAFENVRAGQNELGVTYYVMAPQPADIPDFHKFTCIERFIGDVQGKSVETILKSNDAVVALRFPVSINEEYPVTIGTVSNQFDLMDLEYYAKNLNVSMWVVKPLGEIMKSSDLHDWPSGIFPLVLQAPGTDMEAKRIFYTLGITEDDTDRVVEEIQHALASVNANIFPTNDVNIVARFAHLTQWIKAWPFQDDKKKWAAEYPFKAIYDMHDASGKNTKPVHSILERDEHGQESRMCRAINLLVLQNTTKYFKDVAAINKEILKMKAFVDKLPDREAALQKKKEELEKKKQEQAAKKAENEQKRAAKKAENEAKQAAAKAEKEEQRAAAKAEKERQKALANVTKIQTQAEKERQRNEARAQKERQRIEERERKEREREEREREKDEREIAAARKMQEEDTKERETIRAAFQMALSEIKLV